MKKLSPLVLAVFVLLPETAAPRAQGIVCALGLTTPGYQTSADQPASSAMAKDLKTALALLCPKGCGRIALFKNTSVSNVLMMSLGNGASKIVYNPSFIDRLQNAHGADARLGILAHQIGHHVDANGRPAAWMDPSWTPEVRADAWAGCVLAKTGISTDSVEAAFQTNSAGGVNHAGMAFSSRSAGLRGGHSGCAGGGRLRAASLELSAATAKVGGGCASNAECKSGRWCMEGRCRDRTSRGVCLKDVDCPDAEICTAAGRCDAPTGGGRGENSPAVTAVSLDDGAKTPRVASDCHSQCELERRGCRISAASSLNQCLARLRSHPDYVACACPNWPANQPDCRRVCEEAFDNADGCETSYVPARDSCLAAIATCGACDTAPGPLRSSRREAALK